MRVGRDRAGLKNVASRLIGRFLGAAISATRAAHPQPALARYGGSLVVPQATKDEIDLLKGVIGSYVMESHARQPVYAQQRIEMHELASKLLEIAPAHLDAEFVGDWNEAADDTARKRVVVDQVASLTDQNAHAWHRLLAE